MALDSGQVDYRGGEISHSGLAQDLAALVDGDVRFDAYSRTLYATDASIYRVMPIGVVMPKSRADVIRVVEYADAHGIPVLPRGGGTSLAGQAVNKAIVLDFTRYMNRICDVDLKSRTVRVEPGVTLAALNDHLAPYRLKFAPDPAAGDRSAVGGAIGNNSSGSHSLVYGKTDVYLASLDVVLASGESVTFGEIPTADLDKKRSDASTEAQLYDAVARILDDNADEIERVFPKLKRNVSGYNLNSIAFAESFNLARLMAGSEGTLGVVVEATLRLEPVPNTKGMALLCYETLDAAMEDVHAIVDTGAAAVEVMDKILLDLARATGEFSDLVDMLPGGTASVLLVEYYADDVEGAVRKVDRLVEECMHGQGHASAALKAFDGQEQSRFWKLRKAGLPILLSKTTDAKHIPFIEDTAIPPERLPEYVREFQAMLDRHDTYASFYAHAGPGVLHIRPLINIKDRNDLEKMYAIAGEATDLVMKYGGSVSGEHGDGRARTQWNRKLYGERLWQAFLDIKETFDPKWLLNPGQVVYREDEPADLRENLRVRPEQTAARGKPPFEPVLAWENANGMQGMVELCHGCGGCRTMDGGVMCPTYRATQEEITSTRGRANMLREAINGNLPREVLFSEEFQNEVLDLCIGCKGCKRDCPSQVDMAKLKAEVKHAFHQQHGIPLRDRLFANVSTLNRLGSRLAPLTNVIPRLPGARLLMEKRLGIARARLLPKFHRETFAAWFRGRVSRVDPGEAHAKVKFLIDCYSNHNHPQTAQDAVRLLEAAGVYVELAENGCCGRPAMSKGILDQARAQGEEMIASLETHVDGGWDIVGVEPSCVTAIQDDYFDVVGQRARRVAGQTYEIMEYLDELRRKDLLDLPFRGAGSLTYHGHCHQKAGKKELHAPRVLEHAGFSVDVLESGCCGMAGSFGYESEHFDMSMAIGRILFEKIQNSGGQTVVAPGASCATQILQGMGIQAAHPVELLARRLPARSGRDRETPSKPAAVAPAG